MLLPARCRNCNNSNSHGYTMRDGAVICADCKHVSLTNVYQSMPAYKKQRAAHQRDLIQPFKVDKHGKAELNRDFAKVYPTKAKEIQSELQAQAQPEQPTKRSYAAPVKRAAQQ